MTASVRRYARFGALAALCETIRTLSYARTAHLQSGCAEEDVASLEAPLAAAEASAFALLDRHPDLIEEHRETILASLHGPLIERLSHASAGGMALPVDAWRLLLTSKAGNDIALMASRGLGLGRHVATVFHILEHQVQSRPRAQELAAAIAEHIGAQEQARIGDSKIIWFDDEIRAMRTPLFAPYMRAQVQAFSDDAIDAVSLAVMKDDLETLVRFWLAGLPDEVFHLSVPAREGSVAEFYRSISSNHGRLGLLESVGSLEGFLQDDAPGETQF